jgi:hypothetical protein
LRLRHVATQHHEWKMRELAARGAMQLYQLQWEMILMY